MLTKSQNLNSFLRNVMAYFTNVESGKRYISLFFSTNADCCSGELFALGKGGVFFTSLLPPFAFGMAFASILEILSWLGFLLSPTKLTAAVSYFVNWGQMLFSLAIAVAAASIVSYSQVHAVTNQDYFRGPSNTHFEIDWRRSVSMCLINVLFAVNGILFTLWVNCSPEQGEEYGPMANLGYVLSLFAIILLPGAFRLAWLFKLRRAREVRWC
jgi:hypothetical protein